MDPQVKKQHYFQKKYDDLSRFVSYYYQVDLARSVNPEKILEIGKGNGMVSDYLKKIGFPVTTCDFDQNLNPDIVADVRSIPVASNSFDAVLAYEMLEHLPFEEFEKCLQELKRISKKNVLISLPYKSSSFEFFFKFPGVRTLFKKGFLHWLIRIPLKFGGIKVSGQHYWEIDLYQWPLRKVRGIIERHFKIKKEFSPPLNSYHRFFLLEK
ncbi:MAG: methyltransferase type 11 [Parcubacteria group bacterium Gr01-1014_3]|nr:MAG: methyltransferase type 11 [Parcubacteria group bacterium Gr01-1014_3]